jgi:hypothetical protein
MTTEREAIKSRLMDALADLYQDDSAQFVGDVERCLFYATGWGGWGVRRVSALCADCQRESNVVPIKPTPDTESSDA